MASSLPWIQRIEELIADGPVEVNWLIGEVSGLVPPGRAWRAREWLRSYASRKKGLQVRTVEVTDEAIWSGQRTVVREAIGKLVWAKKARYLMQDGVKYLEKATPPVRDRSESARRAWENRDEATRQRWITSIHQISPEQRSERTRKGWETRRQNRQNNGQ